jgi:hypothetical protein
MHEPYPGWRQHPSIIAPLGSPVRLGDPKTRDFDSFISVTEGHPEEGEKSLRLRGGQTMYLAVGMPAAWPPRRRLTAPFGFISQESVKNFDSTLPDKPYRSYCWIDQ